MTEHGHDHAGGHGSELSAVQLRVRALETVLTEKGYVDPGRARCDRRDLRDQGRAAHRRAGRGQGMGRSGIQARRCWRTPPRQPARCSSPIRPAITSSRSRTRRRSTTWSCARSARAIRGTCSGCRRSGTSRRRTGRARSRIRAACSPTSASSCRRRRRSASGIPRRRRASSSIPMRPPGTEGWSEERLAQLVTRDSMIGTGIAKDPAELA